MRPIERLRVMARFELKNLWASRGVRAGVLLALAAGAYSVYYGRAEMAEQHRVIRLLPEIENDDTQWVGKEFPGGTEAGATGYYHYHATAHPPSRWAGLSIGQRDVQPYFLQLNLMGVYGQLFNSDLDNPMRALSGNFDLAFVIVTLFPLLIIGLGYNLLSGEEDLGTFRLLRSLSTPVGQLMWVKLAVRFALTTAMAACLLAAGMLFNAIAFDGRALAWLAASAAYFAFWFALAYFIGSWRRPSAVNAAALLCAWLGLTVIAPSALNLATTAFLPVPHAYELIVKHRQATHEGWDQPKDSTMSGFYRRHPEFAGTAPIEGRFSWKWYFGMQDRGDAAVEDVAAGYFERLRERDLWARRAALLSPPLALQLAYNRLARTDLGSHLDYLQSVNDFHGELQRHLYPLIFKDASLKAEQYADFPKHRFTERGMDGFLSGASAATLLLAAALAISASLTLSRKLGEGA